MNALYCDMRRLNINFRVGEIPDTLHARSDQTLCQVMGGVHGDSEDANADLVFNHKRVQFRKGKNWNAVDRCTDNVRIGIKGGQQFKAAVVEGEVFDQGAPQVAGAQEDGAVAFGHAQNLGNLLAQIGDSITVTLLAELTKTTQVLANLGSGDAHVIAQGRGGDANVAFLIQVIQGLIIAW